MQWPPVDDQCLFDDVLPERTLPADQAAAFNLADFENLHPIPGQRVTVHADRIDRALPTLVDGGNPLRPNHEEIDVAVGIGSTTCKRSVHCGARRGRTKPRDLLAETLQ